MELSLTPALARLIAQALGDGAEVSIGELATLLGKGDLNILDAVAEVYEFVGQLELELHPGFEELEYESPRVLRSAYATATGDGRVLAIMQTGEGARVEFKSSLLCSMKDYLADGSLVEHPSLHGEILKTICAFLNSDGGELLVGVSDDGLGCEGIATDMALKKWTLDQWQLNVVGLIRDRFHQGDLVLPYVRLSTHVIDGCYIARFSVIARANPCFVRRTKASNFEAFIRNGSRSDALDLPAFYEHLMASGRVVA